MSSLSSTQALVVPIKASRYDTPHLDTDDPNYVYSDPALYLTLALAYDSLAGPSRIVDANGVSSPDFAHMQPRLATAWQETPELDWIVELRNAKSHAGNELCADDILWLFSKCFNHQTLGSWRWRQSVGLEEVAVLGPRTVRYKLRAGFEHFPNWLLSTTPNIVDSREIGRHVNDGDPWGISWLNANVAGFGAYDLEAIDAGGMTFAARSDYWMGRPPIGEVELRAVDTRPDGLALLDTSAPVVVVGPDPDELSKLIKREDLAVERVWAGHLSVEIDFTAPPFDDIRVRHALGLATPYAEIIDKGLLGFGRPWRSPVKGVSQWYEPSFWKYDTNLDQARQLLTDAGYGDGFDSDFYLRSRPDCDRIAQILQSAWRKIGVNITIKPTRSIPTGSMPPLHLRTECSHNLSEPIYDIAHDYVVIDPILPPPGGPKGAGLWRPRWERNDAIIEMFQAMLMESDKETKRVLFMAMQEKIVHFYSSIFLAENQHALVCNSNVPREFYHPGTRFFQALQYQNCTSNYLPTRASG